MEINSENKSGLVKKALDDKDSFVYLFELYYSEIFAFCAKRVFNRVAAEQVCSDVFLRMTGQLSRLGENLRQVRHWLYRTACAHCSSTIKNMPVNSGVNDLTVTTPLNVDLSNAQKLSILKNDVLALTADQQNVFSLRFFAGMEPDEIGQVLNMKYSDVRESLKDITVIFTDSRTEPQSEDAFSQIQTSGNEKQIRKFVNSIDFDDQVNPQHHDFLLSDIVRQWRKQKEAVSGKGPTNKNMLIIAGLLLGVVIFGLAGISIYYSGRAEKAEKIIVEDTPKAEQSEDQEQQAKRIINEFQLLWEMAKQGNYESMSPYLNSDQQIIRDTTATFLANTNDPQALDVLVEHLKNRGIIDKDDIVYKSAMKLRKSILSDREQANDNKAAAGSEFYSGKVEDFDFNPLSEVKVQGYLLDIDDRRMYRKILRGGYNSEGVVFTDEQGSFEITGLPEFDPLTYKRLLVFTLPGYASYSLAVEPDSKERIEVVLDRGAAVGGIVENEQGVGVESATVMVSSADEQNFEEMIYLSDLTDSTGRFLIEGLTSGTSYDITVLAEGLARYSSRDNEFESPVSAGSEDVRIALKAGSVIRGHLLLPDRTRFQKENIYVAVTGSRGTFLGVTDKTGFYEIENIPASRYRLIVNPEDLGDDLRSEPVLVRVEPEAVIEADILLEAASSLLVEIVDVQTGESLSNYPVSLMGKEVELSKKTRTDSQGLANFDISPGAYSIIVPTYSQQGLEQYVKEVIINDLSKDLEITVEINPVGDVEIQAVNINEGPVRCTATMDNGLTLNSDDNGIVTVPLPGPGEGAIFSALIISEGLDNAELTVLDSDQLVGNDDMMRIGLRPVTEVLVRVAMPDLTPALEPQFAFVKEYKGKGFVLNLRVSPVEINSDQPGYYSIYPVPVDSDIILRCRSSNYFANISLSEITAQNVLDLGQVILTRP